MPLLVAVVKVVVKGKSKKEVKKKVVVARKQTIQNLATIKKIAAEIAVKRTVIARLLFPMAK